jgi:hypothetical protein
MRKCTFFKQICWMRKGAPGILKIFGHFLEKFGVCTVFFSSSTLVDSMGVDAY